MGGNDSARVSLAWYSTACTGTVATYVCNVCALFKYSLLSHDILYYTAVTWHSHGTLLSCDRHMSLTGHIVVKWHSHNTTSSHDTHLPLTWHFLSHDTWQFVQHATCLSLCALYNQGSILTPLSPHHPIPLGLRVQHSPEAVWTFGVHYMLSKLGELWDSLLD